MKFYWTWDISEDRGNFLNFSRFFMYSGGYRPFLKLCKSCHKEFYFVYRYINSQKIFEDGRHLHIIKNKNTGILFRPFFKKIHTFYSNRENRY